MRLVRLLLVWVCLLPLLSAHAAGRYRVTLATGGGDAAAVAKRLAAAYHAQLETPVDESGSFEVTLSAATADLLARDPLVARLEAPAVAPDAATTLSLGTYEYDHAGNIRKIGTSVFVYDGESRLSYEKSGTQKRQELTYDGFGNIRTITEGSKLQSVGVNKASNRADVSSPAQNHMSGTYDGAGNMLTAVSTTDTATARTYTFTYDALNVVTKSTTDASRAYVYNVHDERIGVITLNAPNGTEVSSQWTIRDPGGQVLRRFSRQGGQWRWMQDYIYRNGKMLASESNDQMKTLHYHLDHLGSPRLITGNGGTEVARHTYYPFGEEVPGPTPQVAEPKRFTGHERDSGGIDYMHARYYDYSMGRFLSVDPFAGSIRMPQSLNRYTYVLNNPLKFVDPAGFTPCVTTHPDVNGGQPFPSECITVEGEAPEVTTVRGSTSSLYDLLRWATGTLPRHQAADPASAAELADTPAMDNIREKYKDSGCTENESWSDFQGSEFLATGNITGHLVGGFRAKIRPHGKGLVLVHAWNDWGLESATRWPGVGNRGNPSVQDIAANPQSFIRNIAHGSGGPAQPPRSFLNNVSSGPGATATMHYVWVEGSPCVQ
jgi:RHS repeat-associated protein